VLPLPLTLGSAAATINGIAAPLWYVSPGQINLQIPIKCPPGPATLVINNNGRTTSTTLNASATAPAIFNSVTTAQRGSTITLYVTGAGAVSTAIANGAAPASTTAVSALPAPEQRATVTIGNIAAAVSFAGVPPGDCRDRSDGAGEHDGYALIEAAVTHELLVQLAGHDLVHIAPHPGFARLD
jgi:uncharacterized protein (TIGR03437 family)